MAEALHIDRDKLILAPPDRNVPDRFWEMVDRRKAGEPVAYITGRRAFWNIELHVGPGVLVPRPDSEVLIASAIEHFEGSDGPGADPRSRHRPGNAAARGARYLARGARCRRRRVAPGADLRGGKCPAARLRGARTVEARQLGRRDRERFDLILCNPPYVADGAELGPGVRELSPTRPCSPASTGSTLIARSAPQLPRLLEKGGLAAIEIGLDQAEAVTEAARPRRASGAGRGRSRGPSAGPAANLGLNEIAWHRAFASLHQCSGPGLLKRASCPNPRRNRPFISRI